MAEHEWEQDEPVWGWIHGRGWAAGTVREPDRNYPIVEFAIKRSCVSRNLRRRDPALEGKDKPRPKRGETWPTT